MKSRRIKRTALGVIAWSLILFTTLPGQASDFCFTGAPMLSAYTNDCTTWLIRYLDSAKRSIYVAMYEFTSRPLAWALIRAYQDRGVNVKVILDRREAHSKYSKYRLLKSKGIKIALTGGKYGGEGAMHNKFVIIDDTYLITGSFNWTASASKRNEENMLLTMDRKLVVAYKLYFETLWKVAYPLGEP